MIGDRIGGTISPLSYAFVGIKGENDIDAKMMINGNSLYLVTLKLGIEKTKETFIR